jgi:hypothetical protein
MEFGKIFSGSSFDRTDTSGSGPKTILGQKMTNSLSCKNFFHGNIDVSLRSLGINCNVGEVGPRSEMDPGRNPEPEKLFRLRSAQTFTIPSDPESETFLKTRAAHLF